jgi:membrane fusion protein, multidrug efflux system
METPDRHPYIGPEHQLTGSIPPDHQLAPPPLRRRRKVWWVVLIVLLLLLGIGFLLLRRHDAAVAKAEAAAKAKTVGIAITTVTATKGNIGVYLDSIGTVTPVFTDSITSQVDGLITEVHFTEGQRVNKGDPLIDIDTRPYRATLLQAQGALQRDENVLAQASMDLARYRAAWERNAIAKQILDDQEKLVAQDEGTVKNDQGSVDYDQVQLDFCHIVAPISGRVGLRLVDPGNVVQSATATTLAVITQLEPITVIFTIPEDSLGQVQTRMQQGATLPVDALDRSNQKKIATGKLLTIDNLIDTTTGTVKGRALFDNKNDGLFPNEFVNSRLLVRTLRGVTLVPSSVIQQNGQASFVYLIQNNVALLRNVKVGVTDGGQTQVTGVGPGDVLANSSFDKLQNNSPVAISNTPAKSNNSSNNPASTGAPSNSTGGTTP